MKTTAQIFGYCPSPNNTSVQTPKAVRVTVRTIDGDTADADTCWLPRSIATDLQIKRHVIDGCPVFEVTATVPMWWVRKLGTRARWQKAGLSAPPMAQRPW